MKIYRKGFFAKNRNTSVSPENTYVSIKGATEKDKSPYPADVFLIDKNTMEIIRHAQSANNGTYQFNGLPIHQEYLLLAIDKLKQFNAVIQDNVVPK